jgi:serine/threonine protein kinase
MKISDFDSAYTSEDLMVIGRGTKNFRAPEVLLKDCVNPKAADIYSCAIILFVMVTSKFPYSEDSLIEGHDFYELMISNKPAFWEAQAKVQGRSDFDKDFKEIFDALVKAEPEKRPAVGEIVKMKWMQGPCYTDRELPDVMSKLVKPKFISEEDLISAKKSSWTI